MDLHGSLNITETSYELCSTQNMLINETYKYFVCGKSE